MPNVTRVKKTINPREKKNRLKSILFRAVVKDNILLSCNPRTIKNNNPSKNAKGTKFITNESQLGKAFINSYVWSISSFDRKKYIIKFKINTPQVIRVVTNTLHQSFFPLNACSINML